MAPYRASESKAAKTPLAETGIVGEIIRQFADRLAFYRELVQNSLDAGATRIDVRLLWDGHADDAEAEGTMHASVADDGEGMTRDILENRLLVLFRSGKEGQSGKIGKFGIGFSSVLALAPSLVSIHTTRPPDDRWTLELHPDLSYDLFARQGSDARGTTVTLRLPMKRSEVDGFTARSVDALTRWCRHARIPITVRGFVAGRAEPIVERRIDEPFDLDAPIKVAVGREPAERRIIVGVLAGGRRYAGFFKHGLTLLETDESLVGSLAFKVQDAKLEHTLSRDNVRRDAAFEAAIDAVKEVAHGPLVEVIGIELRRLALDPDRAAWARAALAVDASGLDVSAAAFAVPRFTVGGARALTSIAMIRKHGAVVATSAVPLVDAVLARDVVVVDACAYGADPAADAVRALLERRVGKALADVDKAVALVARVSVEGGDVALLERTAALLRASGAPAKSVWLANVVGARSEAPCLAVPASVASAVADVPASVASAAAGAQAGAAPVVVLAAEAATCPLRERKTGVLVLNAGHGLVELARRRAHERPAVAAASLARAALLTWGLLDAKRGAALTEAALDAALPPR